MDELFEGVPEEMVRPPKWSAVLLQVPAFVRAFFVCVFCLGFVHDSYLFVYGVCTLQANGIVSHRITVVWVCILERVSKQVTVGPGGHMQQTEKGKWAGSRCGFSEGWWRGLDAGCRIMYFREWLLIFCWMADYIAYDFSSDLQQFIVSLSWSWICQKTLQCMNNDIVQRL